ncbi:hypothetical protein VTN77DRAFT_5568 [Rasamsonia byssochlamydoides]|uniref:uncharacterized protein n=1 Tax=Rasamsonia byssochlamydoides TaxID=89139 RepID=UPI00374336F2
MEEEERKSYSYQFRDQDHDQGQTLYGTERWSTTPQAINWTAASGIDSGCGHHPSTTMNYIVPTTFSQVPVHRRRENSCFDDLENKDPNTTTKIDRYAYPHSYGLDPSTRWMYLLPGQQHQQQSNVRGSYHVPSLDQSSGLASYHLPIYQTPQPPQPPPAVTTAPVMGGAYLFHSNLGTNPENHLFDAGRPKADFPGTTLGSRTSSQHDSINNNITNVYATANVSTNVRTIKLQNRDELLAYYVDAFHALQQTNCRLIAKAFVKAVEPKKQARYPYNGGKKGPDGTGGDPELTKPAWWPVGVTHREPGHLKKPERVRLLIHILRSLQAAEGKKSRNVTVDLLEDATRSVRRRVKPVERLEILNEIFRVRRAEERYEKGEIDGSTEVLVADRLWKISPSPSPSHIPSQSHSQSHTDDESQSQSQSQSQSPPINRTRSAEGIGSQTQTQISFSSSLSSPSSSMVMQPQQQQ